MLKEIVIALPKLNLKKPVYKILKKNMGYLFCFSEKYYLLITAKINGPILLPTVKIY